METDLLINQLCSCPLNLSIGFSHSHQFPQQRNGLCISALVLLFLNWLGAAVLELPVFVNPRVTRPGDLMQMMLTLSHPLGIIVVVLAFSLRRVPRVQAIIAALLMLVSWPLGYV